MLREQNPLEIPREVPETPSLNQACSSCSLAVARRVVRERADGLLDFSPVGGRCFSLDTVGFQIAHQGRQFLIWQHVAYSPCLTS
jgi:hypothetical protein